MVSEQEILNSIPDFTLPPIQNVKFPLVGPPLIKGKFKPISEGGC